MSSDLVPFSIDQLPAVSTEQLTDLKSSATDYLRRLQLYGCNTDVCKAGKFPGGHWGIPMGEENITDLGPTIDVLPLAFGYKAMDFTVGEDPITVWGKEKPEYQRIAGKKGKGFYHGPSFLVIERTTDSLYELYFGNVSGRQEAGKLAPFLAERKPCTIGIFLKTGKFTYHVPVVKKCSEPIVTKLQSKTVLEAMTKFMTPKEGPEKVTDEQTKARAR
jgi:hypothetical protein